MLNLETLSDTHRRLLAHVCASLREHIEDELEYDRTPDFAELERAELLELWDVVYAGVTDLMSIMHPEEAEKIDTEIQVQRMLDAGARLTSEQEC
jgi:hypothetical protein